jgi:RHS repeat-associated protein
MGATTYENDAAGARTGKTNADYWRYVYDGESRLTQVLKNGVNQLDCAYDHAGMRVKKIEGAKTTYYVYSGPNPLIEYSPTDGKYLYRIYAGKQAIAEEKDGVVKFYHKDHLGSTRVVTDAAGVKIAEYKFAPYGENELSTGEGTEYGFTDKAEDVTTGLKYFGARFYDAECGRFLTADTYTNLPNDDRILLGRSSFDRILGIGFSDPQQYNQYSYCQNNPINRVDPDGHFALAIPIAIYVAPAVTIAAKTVMAATIGVLIGKMIVEARDNTGIPERTVGEKWQDFLKNREDWEKVKESTEPGNKEDTTSYERTYKNTKTGEKLYTHEIKNHVTDKVTDKEHPRGYSKAKDDEQKSKDEGDNN